MVLDFIYANFDYEGLGEIETLDLSDKVKETYYAILSHSFNKDTKDPEVSLSKLSKKFIEDGYIISTVTLRFLMNTYGLPLSSTHMNTLAKNKRLIKVKDTEFHNNCIYILGKYNILMCPDLHDTYLNEDQFLKEKLSEIDENYFVPENKKSEEKMETAELSEVQIIVKNFIEDCCKKSAEAQTNSSDLYLKYKEFCELEKEDFVGHNNFIAVMNSLGYISYGKGSDRVWNGLKYALELEVNKKQTKKSNISEILLNSGLSEEELNEIIEKVKEASLAKQTLQLKEILSNETLPNMTVATALELIKNEKLQALLLNMTMLDFVILLSENLFMPKE